MGKSVLCFIVLSIRLALAWAQRTDAGHMMDRWNHMMGYGYVGLFMWIVLLIALGVGIYFVVQSIGPSRSGHSSGETPMDILKRRYAEGEITKAQFDEMKKNLED
jgi:putative membrane protein